MSGKAILYLVVLIYIVSQAARCDLANTLSAWEQGGGAMAPQAVA